MRIIVICKKEPVPIYTGLNLIIQNVISRLNKSHDLKILVVDGEDREDLCEFEVPLERFNYSCTNNLCRKEPISLPKIASFYGTDSVKMAWLYGKIGEYEADLILGFGYDLLGYFGLLDLEIPKILDVVDSEVLYLWREIKKRHINFLKFKQFYAAVSVARKYVKRCQAVITVSPEDTSNLIRISRCDNIHTIPNGVNCEFFRANDKVQKKEGQIVFCGSLNWPPNQEAIRWFLNRCWNKVLKERPKASLVVIGKMPPDEIKKEVDSYPNVKMLGFVEDIRPYVNISQVSIAPMVSGSGIKNKILEAWAMSQPVVSTPLGAKGLNCEHGKNILLADSPHSFVAAIIRLLDDKKLRDNMGIRSRKNAVENYSWETIVQRFEEIIRNPYQKTNS